jgi:signal transduction histidine kinase
MPSTEYSPRARAERVIASGRACLALFALVGVVLDPSDPDTFADETRRLLLVYSIYAALVWLAVKRGHLVSRRAAFVQHGFDLLMASFLTMLTHGSGSPFFLFFTFLLLCATVRWQAHGALTTGLVVIATYIGVTIDQSVGGVAATPVEVNRFVVRLGLLSVMTMVLSQLGAYQQRLYSELRQLAAWPRRPVRTLDDVLEESLAYAALVLHAPVAALVWEVDDEERTNVALVRDGRLVRETVAGSIDAVVSVPAPHRSFLLVRDGSESRAIVLTERLRDLTRPILRDEFLERYDIRTVLGAAAPERADRGWLLALNRPARTLLTDDLLLAEIVAADVGAAVEHWYLSQRARDAAVAEERLRVSRDLHDGVLQSLTGCRLNIAAAAAAAEGQTVDLPGQLHALERSLAYEQQALREVIQNLREPALPRERRGLLDMCHRVERQWRITVALSPGADAIVPENLNAPALLMVHEAIANATRHGKATSVTVDVERSEEDLLIVIGDDGSGFPFRGRMQGAELAARGAGPLSLRERAEALGGMLAVTSSDSGSTVEIRVPIARESKCA